MERSSSCHTIDIYPCLNPITKQFSESVRARYALFRYPVRPLIGFEVKNFQKVRSFDAEFNKGQVRTYIQLVLPYLVKVLQLKGERFKGYIQFIHSLEKIIDKLWHFIDRPYENMSTLHQILKDLDKHIQAKKSKSIEDIEIKTETKPARWQMTDLQDLSRKLRNTRRMKNSQHTEQNCELTNLEIKHILRLFAHIHKLIRYVCMPAVIEAHWLKCQEQDIDEQMFYKIRLKKLLQLAISSLKQQMQKLYQAKKLKKLICRICDCNHTIESMSVHCQGCKDRAEKRKQLIEINIQVASCCDEAYAKKNNLSIRLGMQNMKELRKRRLQQKVVNNDLQQFTLVVKPTLIRAVSRFKQAIKREDKINTKALNVQEVQTIQQALQLIINFGEKVINQGHVEDPKFNAITANELSLALSNIDDREVKDLIIRIQGLISDRMDCFTQLKRLDQKEHNWLMNSQSSDSPNSNTPQEEELMMKKSTEMKKKFQQKNSSSMSFRVSKFGHNKLASEKLKEESELKSRKIIGFPSISQIQEDDDEIQGTPMRRKQLTPSSNIQAENSDEEQERSKTQKTEENSFDFMTFTSLSTAVSSEQNTIPPAEPIRSDTPRKSTVSIIGNISMKLQRKQTLGESSTDSPVNSSSRFMQVRPTQVSRFAQKSNFQDEQTTEQKVEQPERQQTQEDQNDIELFPYKLSVERGYHSDSEILKIDAEKSKKEQEVGFKDFEFIKSLGQGAYGGVFLVKKKTTNDLYALKVIDCSKSNIDTYIDTLKSERNVFEILSGTFVTKAYYSFTHGTYLCFLMEYMMGGDFGSILKLYTCLDEIIVKCYMAELVLAIEYLHENGIVHRDLKPENILLDEQGHIKLADFGLSELGVKGRIQNSKRRSETADKIIPKIDDDVIQIPSNQTEQQYMTEFQINMEKENKHQKLAQQKVRIVGTPDYIAPEVINGESIANQTLDFWSLGVIMYELLCGTPPFNDETVEQIFSNIVNRRLEMPSIGYEEDCISPEAADLIERLLDLDFNTRLGAKGAQEIKQHSFFSGVNWQTLRDKPGFIIPKMIMPEVGTVKKEQDKEKVTRFLQGLEKREAKSQNLEIKQKLMDELKGLERLDLLQQMSSEEAAKHMYKLYQLLRQLFDKRIDELATKERKLAIVEKTLYVPSHRTPSYLEEFHV